MPTLGVVDARCHACTVAGHQALTGVKATLTVTSREHQR